MSIPLGLQDVQRDNFISAILCYEFFNIGMKNVKKKNWKNIFVK
jgi:hypothetical protein